MSDDYAFFEYRAKITNAGHAEEVGDSVHCFIKMKSGDEEGKRRRNVELEQLAGDNILFVLNPGPHRKISHSSIWVVSEEAFHKSGAPIDRHRVGDCEILCHRDWIFLPDLDSGVEEVNRARTNSSLKRIIAKDVSEIYHVGFWSEGTVTKGAISNKGPRIATNVSLAGTISRPWTI
jgi:hypothetical protein